MRIMKISQQGISTGGKAGDIIKKQHQEITAGIAGIAGISAESNSKESRDSSRE